jgi:glycosyltransferase involved in cell wall biosynthesis
VIATSAATKSDIISLLNISPSKVTPLYSGVEVIAPTEEALQRTGKKFNLQRPFILTVGKVEPRKNIGRLIEGFSQTKKDDWDLIIVGPQGWDYLSKDTKKSNIKFTGYVTDKELSALYHLCQFFVYPSLWEGFGYPIIEAMLHKKAVAASNNSSLKELVDGHGVLFDPLSTFDIAASLTTLMDDKNVRESNEQRGYEYAKQFTWKRYYERLISVFS